MAAATDTAVLQGAYHNLWALQQHLPLRVEERIISDYHLDLDVLERAGANVGRLRVHSSELGSDSGFGNPARDYLDALMRLHAQEHPGLVEPPPLYVDRERFAIRLHQAVLLAGRMVEEAGRRSAPEQQPAATRQAPQGLLYHVAISYADPQLDLASRLAASVASAGYRVFFDKDRDSELWGEDLAVTFGDVFGRLSLYCVIFASRAYVEHVWTRFELQHAIARQVRGKGAAYVLPVKLEDVTLPGLSPTVKDVNLKRMPIDEIIATLMEKLRVADGLAVSANRLG